MCRIAAYAGPSRPLSTLLYDPPHSLEQQSYRPRAMVRGTVNVDGTGVCWWRGGEPEPLRYVTDAPPWSDPNLPSLARRLEAGVQLATVRSATPGTPLGVAASLPFVHGRVASTLNGYIDRFSATLARPLVSTLDDELFAQYGVASDALLLHLLVVQRFHDAPAAGLVGALVGVVTAILELAERSRVEASLNLVASDGVVVAGVRCALGVPSNGLHVLQDGARWPGGALIASEPLDDDQGWSEVPDRSVALWDRGGWRISAIGNPGRRA